MASIENEPPLRILPQTTIQPSFPDVLRDVHTGVIPAESFWVSCYKLGEPSVHGKVSAILDETDPRRDRIDLQGRDGVSFERVHDYKYTASCPGLSIQPTSIVVPSAVYADPEYSVEKHLHQLPTFALSPLSSAAQVIATAHTTGGIFLYTLPPISKDQAPPDAHTHVVPPTHEIQSFAAGRLHKSTPTSLLILPPSRSSTTGILVSSGIDFTVQLASIPTPPAPTSAKANPAELTPIMTLTGHRRAVTSVVATNSPSQHLLSGSKDGTLRLWDLSTSQAFASASSGLSPVNALALPDNDSRSSVVYAALQSGVVEMFDARTRASAGRTASGTPLEAVAASASDHAVVAGGTDGVVHIWDARSLGQERARWKRSGGSIEGVAVLPSASPAQSRVLVGGEDGLPYVAQVASGGSEEGAPTVSVETELVFGDVDAIRCLRVRPIEGGSEVWMAGDGGVVRRYVV